MRADSHYVDQLESRQAGAAIRLLSVAQLEGAELRAPAGIEALTRSIATHGILQPLLVRRHNARYEVIAGRKRLAAAVAAGLSEVPCVVHHVDENEAEALRQAENVRVAAATDTVQPLAYGPAIEQVLRTVAADLAGIGSLAASLRGGLSPALHNRVSSDLIQAQAWRAAWFLSAATVTRAGNVIRSRPVGAILDRVKAGFEPEARLTRLRLDCSLASNAAAVTMDEDLGTTVVTGCVLATLSWLEGIEEPRIDVRVGSPNQRTVRIEVVQRLVPAPPDLAHYFKEPGFVRSGDVTAWLAVQTVKSIAAHHGGSADFTSIGDRGTVLQSTFYKPDAN